MIFSKFRRGLLPLLLLLSIATPETALAAEDAGQRLRAGACEIDITPTRFPISSNGSMRDRQATAAHDPLHVRCLVLDNGVTRVAFAVCDSCAIPRELFDAAKQKASRRTGIPAANMLMSATHTHSAVTVTGVFQSEPDTDYQEFLIERIAAGIEKAATQLEPAKLGWTTASDPSQVFNRRWYMKPGFQYVDPFGRGTDRVRMNPGRAHAALNKPAGPVDPTICLLSVQSVDGTPIAVLANYALHYVGGVPGHLLSADYFGEFARRFTQRIGGDSVDPPFVAMMSNGTSGNINNINFAVNGVRRAAFEQIRIVALSVTDAAYNAYERIAYHTWVPLEVREADLELGVRRPDDSELAAARQLLQEAGPGPYEQTRHIYARETLLLADYPPRVSVKLQAIRIGDLGIVSTPCETFVETGLAIREQSPLGTTFTIELANGYNGYLPTPEHHRLGGYETWRARSSYLAVDAEPQIRSTLLALLRQVAED